MMLYSISISLSLSLSYSPIHTSRVFFIIPYFPHFLSCLLLSLFFSHFCPLNLSSPPLSFYSARTDLQLLFLLLLFPKHSLITKSTFVVSFDPIFLFISSTLWLFLPLFLPLFLSLSLSLLLFLFSSALPLPPARGGKDSSLSKRAPMAPAVPQVQTMTWKLRGDLRRRVNASVCVCM